MSSTLPPLKTSNAQQKNAWRNVPALVLAVAPTPAPASAPAPALALAGATVTTTNRIGAMEGTDTMVYKWVGVANNGGVILVPGEIKELVDKNEEEFVVAGEKHQPLSGYRYVPSKISSHLHKTTHQMHYATWWGKMHATAHWALRTKW